MNGPTMSHLARTAALAVALTLAAGCGGGPAPGTAGARSDRLVPAIHAALPAKIRDAGELQVVISGPNPPWWTTTPGRQGAYTGAGAELMDAVGQVMGVDVRIVSVPDVS